jgi:PAS domain S-box-containing protein
MGVRIRRHDWSRTPLGPPARWPQSLKTAVGIMLTSRYAMFVWWGRALINLYNDAYRPMLGARHPTALGRSAQDVWSEIWHQIGPRTDSVLLRGEATFDDALLLLMARHGYSEETYFTFSYSPIPGDDGGIGGLFCTVTEETQRIIGERRLRTFRDLAADIAEARTEEDICRRAIRSLGANTRDLPFVAIYLTDADGGRARLVSAASIESGHPACPQTVDLRADPQRSWPFSEAAMNGNLVIVGNVDRRFGPDLPTGAWARPPEIVVGLPIVRRRQGWPVGVLVAGPNPHRPFDAEVRAFLELITGQIAAVLSIARAHEEERRRAETLAQLRRESTHRDRALSESERRFRLLANMVPEMIWTADPDGVLTFTNDRWLEYCGLTVDQNAQGWPSLVLHPDDRDRCLAAWTAALRDGSDYEIEARNRRHDGVYRWFLTRAAPVRDADGRTTAWFGASTDIDDRKRDEQALQQSRERLRLVLTTTGIRGWTWDLSTDQVTCVMPGESDESVIGGIAHFLAAVHPDDRDEVGRAFARAAADHTHFEREFRVVGDGGEHWLIARGTMQRDEFGRPTLMVGVNIDITERRRAEERQRLLVNELNHRVKNSLATVQSIAMQSLRRAASPQQFQEAFGSRLRALSQAHDLLTKSAWQGASLGKLVQQTLAPYRVREGARITVDGPEVRLGPNAAVTLHMAFHELATNAAKYGALSASGGQVRVVWTIDRDAGVDLQWTESGGPAVAPPRRRGFGSRLIERGVARELAGDVRLDFAVAGLSCRLRLPLSGQVAAA